jgi:prophage regulatory protein
MQASSTPTSSESLLRTIEARLPPAGPRSFSRARKVRPRIGDASNSTYYSRIANGVWPKGISLGPNFVAWDDHEVDVMCEALAAEFTDDQLRQLVREIHARRTGSEAQG